MALTLINLQAVTGRTSTKKNNLYLSPGRLAIETSLFRAKTNSRRHV